MKKLFLIALILPFIFSCSREYYKTASYDHYSKDHRIVAVLPVQTITSGRINYKLSEEDIWKIEEAESRAFQAALFNHIGMRTGSRYGEIRLDIQHYAETNARLEEKGISIRDSWEMSPVELAEVLGVDAVVRTTLEKEHYLTELESFGISVAAHIVHAVSNSWFLFPIARTSDVLVYSAILDGTNGVPLWVTDRNIPTYWHTNHNEVVDRIARSLARRFPYRGF